MKTSKGEKILRKILERRYQNMRFNVRLKTLINPKTGKTLELDIYIPHERLAFEFQGSQHSNYYQSFKDELKRLWCNKNKITYRAVWAKTLPKIAIEYGVPSDSELMEAVLNYSNKSARINSKGHFKTSAHGHAQKKARFTVKAKRLEEVQKKEGWLQRYKTLIRGGMLPKEAEHLCNKQLAIP